MWIWPSATWAPERVASGEQLTYTMFICRARVGANKTLSLAVMEINLNIFLNDTQFRHSNGPISSHVTKEKICVTDLKQLKQIRDSWICEKLWLKAAKSVTGKWILLKFVREARTKPPTSPPKLLCRFCWFLFTSFWINLRSSAKREIDVLEITTFLPASDLLFGSRLIFKQSCFT